MNTFRAGCAVAAMGLLIASAVPQGERGKGDGNKAGGNGGPVTTSGQGQRGGGSSSGGGPVTTGGQGQRGGGSTSGGMGRGGAGSGGAGGYGTGGSATGAGQRGGWGSDPTTYPQTTRGGLSDSALGRKGSRSGTTQYGGSNNVASITKVGGAIIIGRAPVDLRSLTKRDRILRRDNIQLNVGGFRVGYYFYDSRWRDDYFWYPWYQFDPWGSRCCVSPWYYYPMLPAYISWDRCHFYSFDPWNSWLGNSYQWQRPNYYGNYDNWGVRRSSEVDYAIDDIVSAFERADRRAASRLVPERSEVAIYVDGRYSYSLNSDDFYDMFMDATQNTRTRRYEILDVESGRDYRDVWRVTARHTYEDPWGRIASVNHYYELRYEGRNLVISKFGVSGDGGF